MIYDDIRDALGVSVRGGTRVLWRGNPASIVGRNGVLLAVLPDASLAPTLVHPRSPALVYPPAPLRRVRGRDLFVHAANEDRLPLWPTRILCGAPLGGGEPWLPPATLPTCSTCIRLLPSAPGVRAPESRRTRM